MSVGELVCKNLAKHLQMTNIVFIFVQIAIVC